MQIFCVDDMDHGMKKLFEEREMKGRKDPSENKAGHTGQYAKYGRTYGQTYITRPKVYKEQCIYIGLLKV